MAGVDYVRPELYAMLAVYSKIDDFCAGEEAVKAKGELYLPKPKHDKDEGDEYNQRWLDYQHRAVYVNFAGRTVEGLSGLVFAKKPIFELPPLCKVIEKNADGSGVSLVQIAKILVDHLIKKGRSGVLVDYPTLDRVATRADMQAGNIRPTVNVYNPANIINWDAGVKGGKVYNTLIVLKEAYSDRNPADFEIKRVDQYRVLELVDANGVRYGETVGEGARYRQVVYRKRTSAPVDVAAANEAVRQNPPNLGQLENAGYQRLPEAFPRDGKGVGLGEIPFTFVGAVSNDSNVDKPPIIDIVNMNKGHYRNSADYEDSVFLIGQPTPVAIGIQKSWWEGVLNKRLVLGSRVTIPLNDKADVKLLQASPNMLAKEAMDAKEKQMRALGAKMIEEGTVSKTATEDTNDNIAENSVLGNIASNAEAALIFALEWCAIFTGEVEQDRDATDDSVKCELNKKFNTYGSTAADRAQLLKEWLADAISKTEYRRNLRQAGLVLDEDETAETEIGNEQKLQLDLEVERNKILAKNGIGNQPGNAPGQSQTRKVAEAA